jgi:hypothetical protein
MIIESTKTKKVIATKLQNLFAQKLLVKQSINTDPRSDSDEVDVEIDLDDYDIMQKKEVSETLQLDFVSATFLSLKRDVKNKYQLLENDQAEYYFECLFILFMQMSFCIVYLLEEFDTNLGAIHYINNFGVNLCSFFTSFVLHLACLSHL